MTDKQQPRIVAGINKAMRWLTLGALLIILANSLGYVVAVDIRGLGYTSEQRAQMDALVEGVE